MDEQWIWAGVSVVAGLVVGALAGALIRRSLDRPKRQPAVRQIAGPLSLLAFWLLVATGIVVAVAVSSPDRLEPVPTDILDWLPDAAIAGLLLIGGYAVGLMLAATIGRAAAQVSGRRNRVVEGGVRTVVFGGAVVLALNQLGVDTDVVEILVAGLVFGLAAALAGIAIVGGRGVAAHVAAGRTLRHVVDIGATIRVGDISGVVKDTAVAHLVLTTDEGTLNVPYGSIIDLPVLVTSPPPPEGSPD